jgi:hypothetical protein
MTTTINSLKQKGLDFKQELEKIKKAGDVDESERSRRQAEELAKKIAAQKKAQEDAMRAKYSGLFGSLRWVWDGSISLVGSIFSIIKFW